MQQRLPPQCVPREKHIGTSLRIASRTTRSRKKHIGTGLDGAKMKLTQINDELMQKERISSSSSRAS